STERFPLLPWSGPGRRRREAAEQPRAEWTVRGGQRLERFLEQPHRGLVDVAGNLGGLESPPEAEGSMCPKLRRSDPPREVGRVEERLLGADRLTGSALRGTERKKKLDVRLLIRALLQLEPLNRSLE